MTLLAIDPGTTESGWVQLDDLNRIIDHGTTDNDELIRRVYKRGADGYDLAIEMIASYGMPVGAEVFDTCVWIGRFVEAFGRPEDVDLVYRRDVKLHLCGTTRAKDANVRQALVDLFGPPGRKANPGPTFGVVSHAWAALGVAATVRKLERGTAT